MNNIARAYAGIDRFGHWYAVHLLSFLAQDAFCLWLMERSDNAQLLAIANGTNSIVATASFLLIWFCHEADTYDSRPQTRVWLYARAGLAVTIAAIWTIPFGDAPPQIATMAVLAMSVLLVIVTLIDAGILVVRGILAP